MLPDVVEDHLLGDGGEAEEADVAEKAFEVGVDGVAVAAHGLDGAIAGGEGGLGGEILGHVGFGAGVLIVVVERGGLVVEQTRGFQGDLDLGEGELNTLVGADGTVEDDAVGGVVGGEAEGDVAAGETAGGGDDAFGVEGIEDVAPAFAFLADQIVPTLFASEEFARAIELAKAERP